MRLFAIGIELALDVAVQRSHDADTREHRRPARRRHQDQRLRGRLPLRRLVLGPRKLRDVVAGVLQRDELATAGKRDWIFKLSLPPALRRYAARRAAFLSKLKSGLMSEQWRASAGTCSFPINIFGTNRAQINVTEIMG
jgi:hypothetical protein